MTDVPVNRTSAFPFRAIDKVLSIEPSLPLKEPFTEMGPNFFLNDSSKSGKVTRSMFFSRITFRTTSRAMSISSFALKVFSGGANVSRQLFRGKGC